MIKEKWLFIGTDKRLSECSKLMANRGNVCRSIKTNRIHPELEAALIEFAPDQHRFPYFRNGRVNSA